mmetsp:Transcript_68550/g.135516  ORF Transcript_68550/g.135516 Transcript_68550/m.135516 type:complete len:197 (+) Transcript_68550:35-625(+)
MTVTPPPPPPAPLRPASVNNPEQPEPKASMGCIGTRVKSKKVGKLAPLQDERLGKLMEEFHKLDQDGNGEISREELAQKTGVNLDKLIQAFDIDGDGKLQYTDFLSMEKMINPFRKLDTDGSGTICRKELALVLRRLDPGFTDEELDMLLGSLDHNGDGQLDYLEFVLFVCDFSEESGIKYTETLDILCADVVDVS